MELDITLINQFVFDMIYIYLTLSRLEFSFLKSISSTFTYLKNIIDESQKSIIFIYILPEVKKFSKKRGVS